MGENAVTSMLRTLVFGRDAKQAIRIQRLLFASSTYFFCVLFVNYGIRTDLIRNVDFRFVIGAALAVNLIFYFLIRFDLNLRAKDPSLTIPQIGMATFVNTYVVYYAGPARGAFLIGYLLILVFGMFRLRPRQIILIGVLVLAAYATIIGIEAVAEDGNTNISLDILQWLILLFVYPWFAWIAGHIMSGRHELRQSNARLASALAEKEAVFRTLQDQATHDELTGLFNRRYMLDALKQEIVRAQRTQEHFCLLLADIDHFKRINDTVGHLAGDNVLVAVTRQIEATLRSVDRLGRHGGEEFLIMMPSTSLTAALSAAERIRKSVADARISEAGVDVPVTVSIGVAEYRKGASLEILLGNADRALYRAKHNGRNRVECWTPGAGGTDRGGAA